MNERLSTIDGRPVLRIERTFRHPVAKVWESITDPELLSKWYPFKVTSMDFRIGGVITFDDGAGTSFPAAIVEIEHERIFAFSESAPEQMTREDNDLVHIELHPDGDGCLMVFTHTFSDRPAAASYVTGWNGCLDWLVASLDGTGDPEPFDNAVVHEQWIKAFGLDQGRFVEIEGDPAIRFERQLMKQPRGNFWHSLFDGKPLVAGQSVPEDLVPLGVYPGPITMVEPMERIEFTDTFGGQVTWGFSDGPGGVRIDVMHTRPSEQATMESWQECIESMVERVTSVTQATNT